METSDKITLNVYEADMATVKKVCTAEMVAIPFGTIRKLMKLFNVDKTENTADILQIVASSWDSVTSVLDRMFPEMTENDWDTVDIKELVAVIYKLLKFALKEIMTIPTDSKNV